jgi:hypothetical protein
MENPNYETYTWQYRHNYYKNLSNIVSETSNFVLENITQTEGKKRVIHTYDTICNEIKESRKQNKNSVQKTIWIHAIYVADEDKQLNPYHKDLLKKLRGDGYQIDIMPDPHPRALPLSYDIIIKISR